MLCWLTVPPQLTGTPDNDCVPPEYKNAPVVKGEVKVTEISQIVPEHAQSARFAQLSEVEPPLFVTVTVIGFPAQAEQVGIDSKKLMFNCTSQVRLLVMVILQFCALKNEAPSKNPQTSNTLRALIIFVLFFIIVCFYIVFELFFID